MVTVQLDAPRWRALEALASRQGGYFSAADATQCGFSTPLLARHVRGGRFEHVQRGVYRLAAADVDEHGELFALWLWSHREGVFSHETALSLYRLSDVLPDTIHLTVPAAWRRRRLKVPGAVTLHYAELTEPHRIEAGLPVTPVIRTLQDCLETSVSPEFIAAAVQQAVSRGLATTQELQALAERLRHPPGGP